MTAEGEKNSNKDFWKIMKNGENCIKHRVKGPKIASFLGY